MGTVPDLKQPADFAEDVMQEIARSWWWMVPMGFLLICTILGICALTHEPTGADFERATDTPTKWQQH